MYYPDLKKGWQTEKNFVKCLVDIGLNKIAFSSTSSLKNGQIKALRGFHESKHKG